ncbi:hypothetical protein ABW19_dt0200685 [Dactylella cylindrospora]|nr:hypothetical protein ABW19_dt0200685 [Dactylella cylindrospora]
MHRKQVFASIALLLFAPFVAGQADLAGKDGATNAIVSLDAGNTEPEQATQTQSAGPTMTGSPELEESRCEARLQVIGLSSDGPYLPVKLGDQILNLAIVLGGSDTYIFSQQFCTEFLGRTDSSSCIPLGTPDGTEGGLVDFGSFEHPMLFQSRKNDLQFGSIASKSTFVIKGFPYKIVTGWEKDSDPTQEILDDAAMRRHFTGPVHGIIGLGSESPFIKTLTEACDTTGFGLYLRESGHLVFGGIDVNGGLVESNNSRSIVNEQDEYDGEVEISGLSDTSKEPDTLDVGIKFDSAAPVNVLPSRIEDFRTAATSDGANRNVTVEISDVEFDIPWNEFTSAYVGISTLNMTLGAPFFRHVYIAQFPGSGDGDLVFAPATTNTAFQAQRFDVAFQNGESQGTPTSGGNIGGAEGNDADDDDDDDIKHISKQGSNNIGAIVGGVVGGVVGLAIIFVAACFFFRRRKLSRGQSSRSIEKEYEADFDAEIGHDISILPHFTKESGYASIPTPPPPPSQPSYLEPSYHPHTPTEYFPPVQPYSDESPVRSYNVTPIPVPSAPIFHIEQAPVVPPPEDDRRHSVAPTVSSATDVPSPMISRNVSTVSRRDYPSIAQMQNRSVLPEDEEDEDDAVSVRSGPYQQYRSSATNSAPRLPFNRSDADRAEGL